MDLAGNGVPPLTDVERAPVLVDLHTHSTASDGLRSPAELVAEAASRGLAAIALTDHDTVSGLPEAVAAGKAHGLRVVPGCEFSTAAPWGEMHVLGYLVPVDSPELEAFLVRCRADRERRGRGMVLRLRALGITISDDDVLAESAGGAVGRPHIARALLRRGAVHSVNEAFDRYIGRGRPAFVDKTLPQFAEVAAVVHRVGGLVSAAHLADRASFALLERLRAEGLDALETRHPSHDPDTRARLTDLALRLGLLRTGGSDWHGEFMREDGHGDLGSERVPVEWLDALDDRVARTRATSGSKPAAS